MFPGFVMLLQTVHQWIQNFQITHPSRIVLLGGLLVRNHELLLKNGLPLKKNVTKWLAKNALIPLWLTPVASLTYAAIEKNIFWSVMHPSDFKVQIDKVQIEPVRNFNAASSFI